MSEISMKVRLTVVLAACCFLGFSCSGVASGVDRELADVQVTAHLSPAAGMQWVEAKLFITQDGVEVTPKIITNSGVEPVSDTQTVSFTAPVGAKLNVSFKMYEKTQTGKDSTFAPVPFLGSDAAEITVTAGENKLAIQQTYIIERLVLGFVKGYLDTKVVRSDVEVIHIPRDSQFILCFKRKQEAPYDTLDSFGIKDCSAFNMTKDEFMMIRKETPDSSVKEIKFTTPLEPKADNKPYICAVLKQWD